MHSAEILIVDDEEDIRGLIQGILEDEGYRTRQAASAEEALASVARGAPDLLILDIWLQGSGKDGMDVLAEVREGHSSLPVLMISGHGTIETAVSAIKQGAYDFIEKPFKSDRLLLMIERALETAQLRRENQALKEKAEGAVEMLGEAPVMQRVRQALERVAPTNSRVLITGEAGTGKEIAARMLHRLSARSNGPFVALNCALLDPDGFAEALFGSETEDGRVLAGALERAHGGTLLLDEVADMPLETQGRIVRALQEQRIVRTGGHQAVEADVRIMASTSRDLLRAIQDGMFREDLYYRLNVVPLSIPALRERLEDIGLLADHFADLYARQSGQPVRHFSEEAVFALQHCAWPGNVRQLRNAVEWAMIMMSGEPGEPVLPEHLPPDITGRVTDGAGVGSSSVGGDYLILSLREAREAFERAYLLSQVERFGGNISRTAQFVGMERSALHRKLKSLDISASSAQDGDIPDVRDSRKRA